MGKIQRIAEAVHPIFEKMCWKYWDTDGVPSVEVLKNTLKTLKKDTKRLKDRVSTGRFMTELDERGKVRYFLELDIDK